MKALGTLVTLVVVGLFYSLLAGFCTGAFVGAYRVGRGIWGW